jgi:hypothetical protein
MSGQFDTVTASFWEIIFQLSGFEQSAAERGT